MKNINKDFSLIDGFSIVLNTVRDFKKIMFWFLQK